MPSFDLVDWILNEPIWLVLPLALLVAAYFALFAWLHRSSQVNHSSNANGQSGRADRLKRD